MPGVTMTLAHAIELAALYYEDKPWHVLPETEADQVSWWAFQKTSSGNATRNKTLKIQKDNSSVISLSAQIHSMQQKIGMKMKANDSLLMEGAVVIAKTYYENREDNIYRDSYEVISDSNQCNHWNDQVEAGTIYSYRTILVTKNKSSLIESPKVYSMLARSDLNTRTGLFEHQLSQKEFEEYNYNIVHTKSLFKQRAEKKNQVLVDDDNSTNDEDPLDANFVKDVEEDEEDGEDNGEKKMQFNAKEGNAICLLIELVKKYSCDWLFEFAPDGIGADFIARHESFARDEYIMIQMKSACISFGRVSYYYKTSLTYPVEIYCVALGVLNYSENYSPIDCNDSLVEASSVYEMFDIGSQHRSRAITAYPATRCTKLSTKLRCFFKHELLPSTADSYLQEEKYINQFLSNLMNFPHKMPRNEIFFTFDEEKSTDSSSFRKAIETHGLKAINGFLEQFHKRLYFPSRQNETVDSYFVSDANELICISNKTASFNPDQIYSRSFKLSAAPQCNFCHWVIASYNKASTFFGLEAHDRVAVIPAYLVYTNNNEYYCWNDLKVGKCNESFDSHSVTHGVVIFSLKLDGVKLLKYLSNTPPLPSRSSSAPASVIPKSKPIATIESLPKRAKICNGQTSTQDFLAVATKLPAAIAISGYTEGPSSQQTHYSGTTDSDN